MIAWRDLDTILLMQPTRKLAFRAAKSRHTELKINQNTLVFSHKIVKPFFPSSILMRWYLEFKLTAVKSPTSQEPFKDSITFTIPPRFVSSTDLKTLLCCALAWLGLSAAQSGEHSQRLESQLDSIGCPVSRRLDCGQTAESAIDILVKGTEMGMLEICSQGQNWITNQME